jgi:flagellar hook-associated protein 3 FlgL
MTARVSSSAPLLALRTQAMSMQKSLADATAELSTGRRADVGVALGYTLSRSEAARVEIETIDSLTAMDAATQTRVTIASNSLKELRDGATKLRDALVASTQQTQTRQGVLDMARSFLTQFQGAMNRTVADVAVFGGQTLDSPVVTPYDSTGATGAGAAVAAAFQSAFGMSQSDPGAVSIPAAQMESFLNGAFAQQFAPTQWGANWSRATDTPFQSQIAPGESVQTTLSANDPALRGLAEVAVMVSDIGSSTLNDAAFSSLARVAVSRLTEAMDGVMGLESGMGASQNRITLSMDAMKATRQALNNHIADAEWVDPTEASTTISDLQARLEASFAVTARIKELSLLRFL